jgi:hypothetical protein
MPTIGDRPNVVRRSIGERTHVSRKSTGERADRPRILVQRRSRDEIWPTFVVGLDLGQSHDYSALVVAQRVLREPSVTGFDGCVGSEFHYHKDLSEPAMHRPDDRSALYAFALEEFDGKATLG